MISICAFIRAEHAIHHPPPKAKANEVEGPKPQVNERSSPPTPGVPPNGDPVRSDTRTTSAAGVGSSAPPLAAVPPSASSGTSPEPPPPMSAEVRPEEGAKSTASTTTAPPLAEDLVSPSVPIGILAILAGGISWGVLRRVRRRRSHPEADPVRPGTPPSEGAAAAIGGIQTRDPDRGRAQVEPEASVRPMVPTIAPAYEALASGLSDLTPTENAEPSPAPVAAPSQDLRVDAPASGSAAPWTLADPRGRGPVSTTAVVDGDGIDAGDPLKAATASPAMPDASPVASIAQAASDLLQRIVGDAGRAPRREWTDRASGPQRMPIGEGQASWFPAGAAAAVAGPSIGAGMLYVGSRLAAASNPGEPENCLVDPRLPVARRPDVAQPLPYWPSYARLTPGWRRAYLDFLAGPRSNPSTPIGLVFLYFYGLERRVMVDGAAAELAAITSEVRRLTTVYGGNHSFRHYADELLEAADLLQGDDAWTPSFEPSTRMPMRLRLALGRRAAAGSPVDPELLLSIVMSHPETRVRTPARRALPVLRRTFAIALGEAHPSGLLVKRVKTMKAISLPYRAASSTFNVDVRPSGGDVPDVLARDEPLGVGRRLLDACTDALDSYSRDLGKSSGAPPTLAVTSKLPAAVRREMAEGIPDAPLAALAGLCAGGPVDLVDLQGRLGLPVVAKATRARMAEVAAILARFGFGVVPDPVFTMRAGKPGASVVVFALERPRDDVAPRSDAYGSAHLALALGVMVAVADGRVDERERDALRAIARQRQGLAPDEICRLEADLRWFEANPTVLSDVKAHIKDLSLDERRQLLDTTAAVSMADGVVAAREVSVLERIGRQLGLDPAEVYSRLHGAVRSPAHGPDDDLREVVAPDGRVPATPTLPATRAPALEPGLDPLRLAAIRAETLGTSSLLGDIFADEEEARPPVADPAPATADARFAGLDARHSTLLDALSTKGEWPVAEFERLAREAGLMPGAARDALNDWSLDAHDEMLLDGDDPVTVDLDLVKERA